MSRISLERLEAMRRYKMAQRESFYTIKVPYLPRFGLVDDISKDWLSDRGLTRTDVREKLEKMFSCADRVDGVACAPNPDGSPVVDILRANWCKCTSVCAICSARLQGRRRMVYGDPIKNAIRQFRYRYLVTFTVKDGSNLGDRLDAVRSAFRSWYRMGQRRRRGRSGGEAAKVEAAIAGVELKKTAAGLWHVHIHALVFTNERLNYQIYDREKKRAAIRAAGGRLTPEQLRECVSDWVEVGGEKIPVSKLSREWISASRGESCNIDCRPIVGGWVEAERQALEVLKYSSKLAAVNADGDPVSPGPDLVDLVSMTYGRRLFMSLRGFRGLMKRGETEYDQPGRSDYTIVWDYEGKQYAGGRLSMVPLSRRETLSVVGRVVGQWRRERRTMLDAGGAGLAARLDSLKSWYRDIIKNVWRAGVRDGLIESCIRVVVPPQPDPVQLSLFGT